MGVCLSIQRKNYPVQGVQGVQEYTDIDFYHFKPVQRVSFRVSTLPRYMLASKARWDSFDRPTTILESVVKAVTNIDYSFFVFITTPITILIEQFVVGLR